MSWSSGKDSALDLTAARADPALELPLHEVDLPWPCSNQEYEALMTKAVATAKSDGVSRMVFGDLFHTFVHDGPGVAAPIPVRTGDVVERDGFVFADVLPVSAVEGPVN